MNKYSLWLTLPEQLMETITPVCEQLAAQYGCPAFEPHITVVVPLAGEEDQVIAKVGQLLENVAPLQLSTLDVACSVTYFQSVFLRVSPTAALLDLNFTTSKAFDLEPALFMPHISLFYGEDNMEKRVAIAKEVTIEPMDFVIDTAVLTPALPDPKDWRHLAEFRLVTK